MVTQYIHKNIFMNYIFNLINLVFKINRYIFEIYTKNKNKVEING